MHSMATLFGWLSYDPLSTPAPVVDGDRRQPPQYLAHPAAPDPTTCTSPDGAPGPGLRNNSCRCNGESLLRDQASLSKTSRGRPTPVAQDRRCLLVRFAGYVPPART